MNDPLTPDPDGGVFTTMLVVDGAPREQDAHLARLRASVEQLYGLRLPDDAFQDALAQARGHRLARLRLAVAPAPAGAAPRIAATVTPLDRSAVLPGPGGAVELRTQPVAGWRGAHKWNDRRLLEQLEAQTAPALPLLVDAATRHVLESSRANVFGLTAAGDLLTPPLDGRVLPGVTRSAVLELARRLGWPIREAPLAVDDLRSSAAAFLTGAVRGLQRVRAIDGRALPRDDARVTQLERELTRRWLPPASP